VAVPEPPERAPRPRGSGATQDRDPLPPMHSLDQIGEPPMSPNPLNPANPGDQSLLRPREVAALFGVRPSTIARWAREGKLAPLLTPGGHRRYRHADVREVLGRDGRTEEEVMAEDRMAQDAVRLYEQGWNIRQVAARFECSYGVMRRILSSHTRLRTRGGRPLAPGLDDEI
jgi:excisionase family DNA binding protein